MGGKKGTDEGTFTRLEMLAEVEGSGGYIELRCRNAYLEKYLSGPGSEPPQCGLTRAAPPLII